MRIHDDWDSPGFELPPLAGETGPFTRRAFLEVWWRLRRRPGDELCFIESDGAFLPLVRTEGGVQFLGEEDLVDYHSPLGEGVAGLVAAFGSGHLDGVPFRLDSMPALAFTPVAEGLARSGIDATRTEHESAAVLDLPDTFEQFLQDVGPKERHEIRRKRRRFERRLGEARLRHRTVADGLADFVAMHRASAGEKGHFMTSEMEEFFAALGDVAGARIDVVVGDDGVAVAAAFGFATGDAFYLYNSAYDPDRSDASPGIVLLGLLIEETIAEGMRRFDFLKGDEDYKYRLGARRRPLFAVAGPP